MFESAGTKYVLATNASGNEFVHIFTDRSRVCAGILLPLLMRRVVYQGGLRSTFRYNAIAQIGPSGVQLPAMPLRFCRIRLPIATVRNFQLDGNYSGILWETNITRVWLGSYQFIAEHRTAGDS